MSEPQLSIVTVTYNCESVIENTLRSVINSTYDKVEYIVIDGQSNDQTLDIVNSYKSEIDLIVSEPDEGIYDAMNKGIGESNGDFIYFLNAGDIFYNNQVLSKVASYLRTNSDVDILYGDVIYKNLDGTKIKRDHKPLSLPYLIRNTICHQAIFASRRSFEVIGGFNLDYRIRADYDWIIRAFQSKKVNIKYWKLSFAKYLGGGVSSKNFEQSRKEKNEIIQKNFNLLPNIYYQIYLLYLKIINKT